MNRQEFFKTSGTLIASSFLVNPLSARRLKKTISSGRVKITTTIYELHLRQAWTLSRGTWDIRRNVLVRLERDGLVGYGEAAPIPRYEESAESNQAFIAQARPILEKDLWEFDDRWREIDRLAPGQNAAKAALDMAILDWVGKSLKIPLYKFFGLNKNKTVPTTFSISIAEVPVMQKTAQEAKDFQALKIKLGSKDDKKSLKV